MDHAHRQNIKFKYVTGTETLLWEIVNMPENIYFRCISNINKNLKRRISRSTTKKTKKLYPTKSIPLFTTEIRENG